MRVAVTGGTGFVGSHTVAEVVRAGHEPVLMVRDPARIRPALSPLGLDDVASVTGDVTDLDSVDEALTGCDAVIHCASVYSLDPRAARTIESTNVAGTELILDRARRLGLDPIVHVSSFVALVGTPGAVLTADSPPTYPPGAYLRSKADSDRVARRCQDEGAPVTITYPGGVWGPHDPHQGESCQIARAILRRWWTTVPRGGIPVSDVRDVARLHAALLKPGKGPRRYVCSSRFVSVADLVRLISRLTGRRLPCVEVPGALLKPPMLVVDALQRLLPFRIPVNRQAVYVGSLGHTVDDAPAREEYGIQPQALDDTVADTIRWMVETGHLSARLAGRLAA